MATQLEAEETTEAVQVCYNNAGIPVQGLWQKAGAAMSKTPEEPPIKSQFKPVSQQSNSYKEHKETHFKPYSCVCKEEERRKVHSIRYSKGMCLCQTQQEFAEACSY